MASSLVRRSLPRVNWHVKTLFVTWLSQVRLCVSAFELLPVIHSQLDAFAHGRELQGQTDACVHLCWWLHLNLVLLFYMSLIPWLADWRVDSTLDSRFSQWFWCTAKTTKMSLHQDDTVNKLFFLLYCNTFLPAKLTSTYGSTKFFLSPSPPKTCFTVWTKASSTAMQSRL